MTFEEKAKELQEKFQLMHEGCQDWGLVNADSNKLKIFIEFYLSTENPQEIGMTFDLIIASLEEENDQAKIHKYWERMSPKVNENIKIHQLELIHYSQLGNEVEEDTNLQNYKMLRNWISVNTQESEFRLKTSKIEGIYINEIQISKLANREIPINFRLIITYLNDESNYESNSLSYTDQDKNTIKDWFFLRARKYKEWTFIEISGRESNSLFYKLNSTELKKEISKNGI